MYTTLYLLNMKSFERWAITLVIMVEFVSDIGSSHVIACGAVRHHTTLDDDAGGTQSVELSWALWLVFMDGWVVVSAIFTTSSLHTRFSLAARCRLLLWVILKFSEWVEISLVSEDLLYSSVIESPDCRRRGNFL